MESPTRINLTHWSVTPMAGGKKKKKRQRSNQQITFPVEDNANRTISMKSEISAPGPIMNQSSSKRIIQVDNDLGLLNEAAHKYKTNNATIYLNKNKRTSGDQDLKTKTVSENDVNLERISSKSGDSIKNEMK